MPPLLRVIGGPMQGDRYKLLKQTPSYLYVDFCHFLGAFIITDELLHLCARYQTVLVCVHCAQQFNSALDPPKSSRRETVVHNDSDPKQKAVGDSDQPLEKDQPTKENGLRQSEKPVVVQTRAASAGTMRMRFSKNNVRGGSHQYRRHLCRFLPRLHVFDPPEMTSRDAVLQMALHLKRNYGHPSLRFALSQSNVFPVGSMISLRALTNVCAAEFLVPVARYVRQSPAWVYMPEFFLNTNSIEPDASGRRYAKLMNRQERRR